ncbi:hypothetical protein [Streptomyces aquilus]|uniref:hypothetical protein n=1 Tax=Streptomyces aquilus TaxID=2548456 RepID=UPI00367ADD70
MSRAGEAGQIDGVDADVHAGHHPADVLAGASWPWTQKPRSMTWAFFMERVTRSELALSAWEATAPEGSNGF